MQFINPQPFQTISCDPQVQQQINLQFMTTLKAFFHLLMDANNSEPVVELTNSLIYSRPFELAAEAIKSDPDVAAIIEERYVAPTHDLDALLHYPKDSLGYIYASKLKQAGFKPGFYPDVAIDSDTSYIEFRWRQTHDIWHAITGFGITAIEEIGLQAFYLVQCRLPLSGMLIANALMSSTLLEPEDLPDLLKVIEQGWTMGMNAKPLLAQKWEEAWEKPVSQWRSELNVQVMEVSKLKTQMNAQN